MDYGALGAKEAAEWRAEVIAFELVSGDAQIKLRGKNLKEASQDQEFLIALVDELRKAFHISKAYAERALVLAFEREAKERKTKAH